MIVNGDVKGLELVAAAELSGDIVLSQEIISKFDTHADNQVKFNLPARVIAKIFVFKLLYGGSAFGFARDADFIHMGYSVEKWQQVIDAFYTKYKGIKKWHDDLLRTVKKQGYIEIPSGRFFPFRMGPYGWPLTTIKNYPVQGLGADLVQLARIELVRRIREAAIEALFIGTVHDSLVVDTPEKNVYTISMMIKESIEAVPALCKKMWGYDFKLPLTCEVQAGINKASMVEIKF